jgi:hypothetical protein
MSTKKHTSKKVVNNEVDATPKTSVDKAENFKKLAIKRGSKAALYIQLLGNLSSNNYIYTQEQVDNLFGQLEKLLHDTKIKFVPRAEGSAKIRQGIEL